MPIYLQQLSREAYCSALPLPLSTIRPPRLTREMEARRLRAPIDAPFGDLKAEVSSIESEFFAEEFAVKPNVKVHLDPHQLGHPLQAGIAALAIRPPPSSSSSSAGGDAAAGPGPSRFGEPGGILEGDLGPADPPRRHGRPKGSKSWPSASPRFQSALKRSGPRSA